MKKNIFKNLLTVVSVGSLMSVSCIGNFEKLNTHQTDLYPEEMNSVERVGTLLPAMVYLLQPQHENVSQMTDQIIWGQLGGYYAVPNQFNGHGGADHQIASWNPQETMYRAAFTDYMSPFYSNYFRVMDETQGQGAMAVISNVIKAAIMHRVADTYGPIPYSKVGSGAFEVEYDSEVDLYGKILEDLSATIRSLESYAGTKSEALAEYDPMYQGDFSSWLKFANSIKFRIAMRVSSVPELADAAKTAMQEAMLSGMIVSNADNPVLPTADHPVYKASYDWGDLVSNASLSSYMNHYEDPRLNKYFTKVKWYGDKRNGMRLGYFPGQLAGAETEYSKPVLTKKTDLPVFYASESWFLMAEAAVRGLISANAEDCYNKAIELSMQQWGVDKGDYMDARGGSYDYKDDFESSNNYTLRGIPGVSWDSESSTEGHIKQILTQKYIANFPFGLESWSDFRRTGYPVLIPTVHNAGSGEGVTIERGMRRLKYPDSERANNTANNKAAVDTYFGGQDSFSKDLIWAKKN